MSGRQRLVGAEEFARRAPDHRVIEAAVVRVRRRECGEETSCYGCLRGYRNERYHEELSRRAALTLLGPLTDDHRLVPG